MLEFAALHVTIPPRRSARTRQRTISLIGGVAERLNALVLKTSKGQPFVGSNPTPSATNPQISFSF